MAWLVDQRAASLSQLQELLGQISGSQVSVGRVRQITDRWRTLGLVERQTIWHREGPVLWPTSAGAKLAGRARWRRPPMTTMRHTLAVSGVRLRLAPVGGSRSWWSEHDLRKLTTDRHQHIADGAVLDHGEGGAVVVEVELTPHGRQRTVAVMRDHLTDRDETGALRWRRLLYVCSPAAEPGVRAAHDELHPSDQPRVLVHPLT